MTVAGLALGIALAGSAAGGCRAVEGDRILAADLAGAAPAFSAVPGATEVALAPAPGGRRLFASAELRRLAERLGAAAGDFAPVCFTRRLEPLEPARIRAAMEEALGDAKVRLEVIDYLRAGVPAGRLEFPRTGLASAREGAAAVWRGRIRYGSGHSFPVWAKVFVSVERRRVVALRPLTAGKPVPAGAIEVRTLSSHPFGQESPATIAEVEGKLPRRTIPAGQAVETWQLAAAPEVEAGAAVEVRARSGAALLSFTARADSRGRTGDVVLVRNPATGKRFRARVEGRGSVRVEESAGGENDEQNPDRGRDGRSGAGGGASRQEE